MCMVCVQTSAQIPVIKVQLCTYGGFDHVTFLPKSTKLPTQTIQNTRSIFNGINACMHKIKTKLI